MTGIDPQSIDLFHDDDELLFRQFSPKFWEQDGRWSNLTFEPTKSHNFKLSTSRQSKCSAEGAYRFHTENLKLDSCGAWAVTVAEVKGETLPLIDDSDSDNPFHASIDFQGLSGSQRVKKGRSLKDKALIRGRQFPVP